MLKVDQWVTLFCTVGVNCQLGVVGVLNLNSMIQHCTTVFGNRQPVRLYHILFFKRF